MYDDGKHEAVPERAADAEDLLTLLQSQRNYKVCELADLLPEHIGGTKTVFG